MYADTGKTAVLTQFDPPFAIETLPSPPINEAQLQGHLNVARSGEDVLRAVFWFRKHHGAPDDEALRRGLKVALTFARER